MSRLPSIGAEFPCSWYAANAPLQLPQLGLITLDFKGGIIVRVESDQEPGRSVNLRVIGHEVSADSPVVGKVTLTQSDADVAPLSLLEDLGNSFRLTVRLNYQLIIERPPGGGPPLVLKNTQPAVLVSHMAAYPPYNAGIQLQQPVDFAEVSSGKVSSQLHQLPFTISHNP